MAGPSKRSRTSTQDEENAPPTPPPTSRTTRRAPAPILSPTTTTTPPSPSSNTPSRPIQTRSSTLHLAPPTPLTRTSSLFSPTTRRTASSSSSLTLSSLSHTGNATAGPSRVGTLTRTQSSPLLSNPSDLKESVTSGPGGSGRGKGDPEDVFGPGSGRRFGKGKENVPPKKDADKDDAESSRKRLRVGSRASGGSSAGGLNRARSGSVASVRSESSSGEWRIPVHSKIELQI